jgi:hypothetical protein
MSAEHMRAPAGVEVPDAYSAVRQATDEYILDRGERLDAAFMSIECVEEFAGGGRVHVDGGVV